MVQAHQAAADDQDRTCSSGMARRYAHAPMSVAPRRIVTGHDASGRSVVLSDAPTPKTLDIGTAAFHEIWITDRTPAPIAASEPEPTDRSDRPVRMLSC